jgi:acyl-CoA thioester hydrolase
VAQALRHPIRVRYHECDPQGIVFNANYLAYFDMAITELWRPLGGYAEMVEGGTDVVVAEAVVRYRAPLRFDEEIELVVRGVRLGTTSITTELAVERDRRPAAEGEIRHVFVDTAGKPTEIPVEVRAGLAPYSLA